MAKLIETISDVREEVLGEVQLLRRQCLERLEDTTTHTFVRDHVQRAMELAMGRMEAIERRLVALEGPAVRPTALGTVAAVDESIERVVKLIEVMERLALAVERLDEGLHGSVEEVSMNILSPRDVIVRLLGEDFADMVRDDIGAGAGAPAEYTPGELTLGELGLAAVLRRVLDLLDDADQLRALEKVVIAHSKEWLNEAFDKALDQSRTTLEARVAELEAALREIAKGEGEFSRDPSEHAWNTIVNMKGLATAALVEGGDDV